MVRKITHIILAFLLLVTSTGFTISKHYCQNHLVNVAIDMEAKTCTGMDEDGCCSTETVLIQLDDDAVANHSVSVPSNIITSVQPVAVIHLLALLVTVEPVIKVVHEYVSPPPRTIQTVLSEIQSYLL